MDDASKAGATKPTGATYVRYEVIAWFSLAAAIAYICRNSLGVAESTIRQQLQLSEEAMGLVMGPAFFWTYALGQIPMGWLGTKLGSRRLVPVLSGLWSLGTAFTAASYSLLQMLMARGATGIGQAGLFPCATTSFSRWLPTTQRASASGILAACMSLGAAIGAGLTGLLIESVSWRIVFFGYGLLGLVWAIGFHFRFRDNPDTDPKVSPAELAIIRQSGMTDDSKPSAKQQSSDEPHGCVTALALFLSPAMWMICGQQFFRAAAYIFFGSWFATWLKETRDVTTAESGILMSLPLIATVVSSICGGWASDWTLQRTGSLRVARQGVSVLFLTLCALLVLAAFFVENAITATVIISLGVFCAGFAGPCGYAVTMDMGGRHVALVFSTMNMIGNFGAGWLPWFVPVFRSWLERRPGLLETLGGSSWDAVLLLFVALYLLAALFWLLLIPRGTVLEQSLIRTRRG